MSVERQRHRSPDTAAAACARRMVTALSEALRSGGPTTLALSGGSTPLLLFDALARIEFDWSGVHLFQVDERAVPPSDAQSNYREIAERFIAPARFPQKNVHRIMAELEPAKAAARYEAEIREFFAIKAPELPHFDIVHLGIGADAHTASLFPGEALIEERERLVASVHVPKLGQDRITLLAGPLLAARSVVFLIAGREKANAVFNTLYGPDDHRRFPAQLIARRGRRVICYMDDDAGFDIKWEGVHAAP
ncbi:MAG TPA: 6-phosphogluconolactonase [Bryobacteraceae bacterium]|nr:6-phosphogluconolactonase [Bryobacteraceae bacterium]